ncbi:MAG: alginate lyase family protein [bacterium]|nr:alginate lyase family protein [bacterium]
MNIRRTFSRLTRGASFAVRSPGSVVRFFFKSTLFRIQALCDTSCRDVEEINIETLFSSRKLSTEQWFALSIDEYRASADEICEHVFNLLGSGKINLGSTIDWSRGVNTSANYLDVKVPWELSRFYHAPLLAHTYVVTGEAKYLQELKAQTESWLSTNPVGSAPNWSNAMEVGIRAANWCLTLDLLKRASGDSLDKELGRRMARSLVDHGRFIASHREYTPIITNHYLADCVGLVYLGVFFQDTHFGKQWLEMGREGLEECMARQVHDDGVDFEASISYHRLATELFGYAALVFREQKVNMSKLFETRLEKMFEFARQYTKPNGLAPQIGDCDNGRLHILNEQINEWNQQDHRHLFQLYMLLWPEKPLPEQASAYFPKGQIAILRSPRMYCLIDAGTNGQGGNGGHCHNDTLSFELSVDSEDIFIDSGTGVYTSNPMRRNHFRSTRMHNTLTIDGAEQNRIPDPREGLFWVHHDASPRVTQWASNQDRDILVAEHDGYRRLLGRPTHRRQCTLDKRTNELEIIDTIQSKGTHSLEWNFICAPQIAVSLSGDNHCILQGEKAKVQMVLPEGCVVTVDEGDISSGYESYKKSQTIRCAIPSPHHELTYRFVVKIM